MIYTNTDIMDHETIEVIRTEVKKKLDNIDEISYSRILADGKRAAYMDVLQILNMVDRMR